MKQISEHINALPEPYRELAFKNVESQNRAHRLVQIWTSLESALGAAFNWSSSPEGHVFWSAVAKGERPIAPESPEAPPARGGFQVGETYTTRQGLRRKITINDGHEHFPLISRPVDPDGVIGDPTVSHTLEGRVNIAGEHPRDLILPAAKKKVALTASDVPPGSLLRHPNYIPGVFHAITSVVGDGVLHTSIRDTKTVVILEKWHELWSEGFEILRPGGEWTPCWKETEVEK